MAEISKLIQEGYAEAEGHWWQYHHGVGSLNNAKVIPRGITTITTTTATTPRTQTNIMPQIFQKVCTL